MPTNAFLNLTKLKKQKLINDGFKAFSKLKYKSTNVNEITRELGITRTAFYYYFNDKKDFYEYLLYEKREEFMQAYVYNQKDKPKVKKEEVPKETEHKEKTLPERYAECGQHRPGPQHQPLCDSSDRCQRCGQDHHHRQDRNPTG